MAEETTRPTPAAPRVEATHRLFGLRTDIDGKAVLTVVRTAGRRETLIDVALDDLELARLVEDAGAALRLHLGGRRG